MGTSSNMSGFNFDVMGDIVEGITNSVNGGLGELYKILSGYVFITPDAGEANNTAVVNKIGNGTGNTVDKANLPQDGQLLTLRPQVGKSLTLKNNAKTNLSYNGNLLLGSDITLTESESITLRYQNEIKYADAVGGVSENIGGWIVHSTGNGSGSRYTYRDAETSTTNFKVKRQLGENFELITNRSQTDKESKNYYSQHIIIISAISDHWVSRMFTADGTSS